MAIPVNAQDSEFSYGWHRFQNNFDPGTYGIYPHQMSLSEDTVFSLSTYRGDSCEVLVGSGQDWLYTSTLGQDGEVLFVSKYLEDGSYLASIPLLSTSWYLNTDFFVAQGDLLIIGFGINLSTDINFTPNGSPTGLYTLPGPDYVGVIAFYKKNGDYQGHIEYPNVDLEDGVWGENGDLYVSGSFQNTVDFDFSAGSDVLTSNGYYDGFVLKMNALTQSYGWTKTVGGSQYDNFPYLSYSENAIAAMGYIENTENVDIDPGNGVHPINGLGQLIFLQLDASGNTANTTHISSTFDNEEPAGFVADDEGNFYFLLHNAYPSNGIDFDPGAGTVNPPTSPNNDAVYLVKLDNQFQYVWHTSYTSDNTVNIYYTWAKNSLINGHSYIAIALDYSGTTLYEHVSTAGTNLFPTEPTTQFGFAAVGKTSGAIDDLVMYPINLGFYFRDHKANIDGDLFFAGNLNYMGNYIDLNPFNLIDEFDSITTSSYHPFMSRINWSGYLELKANATLQDFEVSPNPSSGFIKVNAPHANTIQVLDMHGVPLLEESLKQMPQTISLADLPTGMYFLKVIDEEGHYGVERLVKQ
jgi:hypothetical protein